MSMLHRTDLSALLCAALENKPGAVNALFGALHPCLVPPARELIANAPPTFSASDLIQETLVEAYQGLPRFHGRTPGELLNWLRRILKNNAASLFGWAHAGKRDARRQRSLPEVPLPAATESPSQAAILREEAERRQAALCRLPRVLQRVLELRALQGLPYSAIAQEMGRSEAAVRQLHVRALVAWQEACEG